MTRSTAQTPTARPSRPRQVARGIHSSPRPRPQGPRASPFAVTVVIAAFGMSIADALPGGLSAGAGFLVGLVGGLAALVVAAIFATHEEKAAATSLRAQRVLLQCAECGTSVQIGTEAAPVDLTSTAEE